MAGSEHVREGDYLLPLTLVMEIKMFMFLRIKWVTKEDIGWKELTPRHCFCLFAC